MGSLNFLSILSGESASSCHLSDNKIIPKLLQDAFLKFSDNTALIDRNRENSDMIAISYKNLDKYSSNIARNIRSTLLFKSFPNVNKDLIIAVCMKPSYDLIATLVAVWKCGLAYLPLSPSFPENRIEHILQESEPLLVISDECRVVANYKFHTLDMTENTIGNGGDIMLPEPKMDSVALVLYTSGSTGVPKGVRLTHSNILNRLQWQFRTLPYGNNEEICVFKTALTFVDSVSEIWGPLLHGLKLLIVAQEVTQNPEQLFNILYEYKVQRMVLVPSLLQSIIIYLKIQNKINEFNNSLKIWICSGEILSHEIAKEFLNLITDPNSLISLYNFYGSTEVMGDVTYAKITKHVIKTYATTPIGGPIDNCNIYLVDEHRQLVPRGNIGEIYVSGKNVTIGYINNRDSDKFCKNVFYHGDDYDNHTYLYRTGDYGQIDDNDVLIYEGRTDSQVKIRGHRIDLNEIQQLIINKVQAVQQIVVLLHRNKQDIFAFIKLQPGATQDYAESEIQQILPAYMVPKTIIVPEIPLLVNGKTDRQSLLKLVEATAKIEFDFKGISGTKLHAAKMLFSTLTGVISMQVKCLNGEMNFFHIGGNSLNSILTINTLFENGYYISIGNFLEAKSLNDIINKMETRSDVNNNDFQVFGDPAMKMFTSNLLEDSFKDTVIDIITTSFYEKADLEHWLLPDVSEKDYWQLMEVIWRPLVEKNLSFAVFDHSKNGKMVGVALNFDINDEPIVEIDSKLNIVFDFLEFIEGPIRENICSNKKGKVLHSFMMGTDQSLTAKENVAIFQFMEQEVIILCKSRGFEAVMTTNTNPLTQQLGLNVFNYEQLLDYQVNQYEANNEKPFGLAPNSQRAIVCYKKVA